MPAKTRIVFWGSPGIAATFLSHLVSEHSDRFTVTACVTQTEKTVQRQGKSSVRSAVHERALALGIPVLTPKSVKKEADAILGELQQHGFDLFVVLAYGKILPESIIDAPRLKSVNFHGSLLPLLRGASPIEHAVLYGFTETGWTLQRIVAALDAGDVIAQSRVPIEVSDTTFTLYQKLTAGLIEHGAAMLEGYVDGSLKAVPQDESNATHCGKLAAEDGRLTFSSAAAEILNRFRAFTPRPGVFAFFRNKKVKLGFHLMTDSPSNDEAGKLAPLASPGLLWKPGKDRLFVFCGDGKALEISTVTPEGKKSMTVTDFINGYRVTETDSFS